MGRPTLRELIAERVVVLDGAMGTRLARERLGPEDFGGEAREGCPEALVLHRPDLVRTVHAEYLAAGADVVETCTFGAHPVVLAEYGLADRAREIARRGAEIAREACREAEARDGRPRYVAGSMGPTTRTLVLEGGAGFDELLAGYREQAAGLLEGGVDVLLVETCTDPLNAKAAVLAIDAAMEETGLRAEIALSATVEPTGTTLAGQTIEAFAAGFEHRDLLWIGLNCATGPADMADSLRTLAAISPFPVACVPNAGLPDPEGNYGETPGHVAAVLGRFLERGWLNVIGGCCGTTVDHVRALVELARRHSPRTPLPRQRMAPRLAGIDPLPLDVDRRPILVGERTNVIGSRKFRELVRRGEWDRAAAIGRAQVRGGAQAIDVCVADPDLDERAAMEKILSALLRRVRVPFVLDTTDPAVLETALRLAPGKPLVNSVNLEDGEERLARVAALVRRHGAALVVGCIDERGMATTAERKLEVARRAVRLLEEEHGIPRRDLVVDPLVFPCASGDEAYRGSARETIEGLRRVREELPGVLTLLGISNVSFGLPPAARRVLNAVFLHEAAEAGLDLAIVDAERLVRWPTIPEGEREAALDLLHGRGDDPVGRFVALFRGRGGEPLRRRAWPFEPVEARLARRIVEADREGLEQDLAEALVRMEPLEIVNGPLLDGMAEVGRLFGRGDLIVAEVLQSAEVMKAAVAWLEPHLRRAGGGGSRGKVLLATVRGDVHDIGKNLVGMLLENNGFTVVDLGTRVDPATLAAAIEKHRPDVIGLSGLLVRSAHQMAATAEDLAARGYAVPMLVGGAALSGRFTRERIAPRYRGGIVLYARDAMQGLDLAGRLLDPAERERLAREAAARDEPAAEPAPAEASRPGTAGPAPRSVPPAPDVPPIPGTDPEVVEIPLDDALALVNEQALYGRHLGLRGPVSRLDREGDPRLARLRGTVREVLARARERGWLAPRGVFRFLHAAADGDDLLLADRPIRRATDPVLARLPFPRQPDGERLSIADWVEPAGTRPDGIAVFVVTAGEAWREGAFELREAGELLASHALGALALELAEAGAEWLHREIRRRWGFPDPPGLPVADLLRGRYRGARVSFGYPACPDLAGQRVLFELLRPGETIGVRLTDDLVMDPEASVSALVFHHPAARYFSVPAS